MQKLKVQAMALALDAKLPSDAYPSVEEWLQRQTERFKDGGFTQEEIDGMVRVNVQKAANREEAKLRFASLIDARMQGVDASGRELLIDILKGTGVFFDLRPGRNLARMVQKLKQSSSRRVRDAYRRIHATMMASSQLPAVQQFFDANAKNTSAWGEHFGENTWWRAAPHEPAAWYATDSFISCPMTRKRFPSHRALAVVVGESGLTKRMHPMVARDARIRRDAISGTWVLITAVEWVALDTGELVWRSCNEAAAAIYFDDDIEEWVRNDTRGEVARYHGGRRDWTRAAPASMRNCIGVELECGFKSPAHRSKFLNRFVDENGRFVNDRPFLIENDSSLGGVPGGCEIISEPLKLWEGYQAPDSHWRWLLDKLNHSGGQGWKHRNVAGIHVNMDVQGRASGDIVRFVALINNAASISRFVSGRKYIFGAGNLGPAEDAELMDVDTFIARDKNMAGGGYGRVDAIPDGLFSTMQQRGKYNPVHIRPNGSVLEVRIFGSNIRYEGFMACVEYCVAGMEYATSGADVVHPEVGAHFRQWLGEHVTEYPNLVSRLGVKATDNSVVTAARPLLELVA